jgi:[ribosomal protein S5]-alanine N-acetyltransferase
VLPLHCLPPRGFETARLRLRAIQESDAQLAFDLYASDPVATRYMSFPCTGRIEDTRHYVEGAARYGRGEPSEIEDYAWIFELADSGEPIGSGGFGPTNRFTLGGGYILGRAYWGRGYATEAWSCLVDWARAQPGVFRIEATIDRENPASGRVLEKSGMRREGVLARASVFPNLGAEPRDAVMYAWARP